MVYGQTEVTQDLWTRATRRALTTVYEAEDVARTISTATAPRCTYEKDGATHGSIAITSPAATAIHGVCRATVPPAALDDLRKGVPVRLAGRARRSAAGVATS